MDKFALSCPVLADESLLLAMKGEFLMSWGEVNWFAKILWVMCLYMKLSPFPGVSPDVFNNKHFSPIFISHRERGGETVNGVVLVVVVVEGRTVWLFVLVWVAVTAPQTVNAICVCVSSKINGAVSALELDWYGIFETDTDLKIHWVFELK